MLRRLGILAAALLLAAILGATLLVDRIELAGLAAGRATAALGREVTIGSLRLSSSGGWLRVALRDASLANAVGGSEPAMARLSRLEAEVRLADLLLGRALTLRGVRAEGFFLLLEHGTGPQRDQPNWRFGPARPAAEPPDRSALPHVMAAAVADAELVFRTSSGAALRIRVESGRVAAPAADQPVTLEATGRYNETALQLASSSGPVAVLRETATPYPVDLTVTSGDTRLRFTGTMTDPLNADGAAGQLSLAAPTLGTLLALAGTGIGMNAGLEVAGAMTRQGDAWRLTEATGRFAGSPLTLARAELAEGAPGQPDRIAVEATLEELNLNRVLGPATAADADADIPIALDPRQDPVLEAKLAIGTLRYARLRASGVRLAASLGPGTAAVEEMTLATGGANLTASLRASMVEGGATQIGARVALADSDLEAMRRTLGLRPLPLAGRVDGRVIVAAEGKSLNQAARDAHVAAVLALRQGRIAAEVIEMASTDLRLLFRRPRGTTPMQCMLAAVSLAAGVGQVAPLRIRAATGTISGLASFDLHRRWLDAVVGSERSTTDFWALDVPMRIWGRFDDPEIGPARWSADGRARLEAAERMAPLPPELRAFAQQNACARNAAADRRRAAPPR